MIRILLSILCALPALATTPSASALFEGTPAAPRATPFAALPLAFEENRGQSDSRIRYIARGGAFDAFLTEESVTIAVGGSEAGSRSIVRLRVAGARTSPSPRGSDPLSGTVSHLIGDDPSRYVVDAPTYARVTYPAVYPGIDLVFHGTERALEYDLIVAPRADPRRIALAFEGGERIELTHDGGLVLQTRTGGVAFGKPIAYQQIRGERRDIEARYELRDSNRIGFRLGRYDSRHPLVIDPILSMSTNVWGAASGVALDASGNIYVVGYTTRSDLLPVAGGYQTQVAGDVDVYVAKLNPAGTAAIFATYLGARRSTSMGLGIAVDSGANVYVTGTTTSSAFPITPGALQSSGSTFVTKLKSSGNALAYSTYLSSPVAAIAVDAGGNAYLTGTTSTLTPTPGVFQSTRLAGASPYVSKLNPTGTALVYATYLGGSGSDEGKGIAVDIDGNAYVVGVARSSNFPTRNALRSTLGGPTDAFVAKLNPAGSALVYSTFLGGSQDERGFGIAVDAAGQAVAVGWTESNDFPVAGAFQPRIGYYDPVNHSISNAFVTKLNAAGNGLVYSSYLGGRWCFTATVHSCFGIFGPDEGIDAATSVAIDAAGYAYVGGYATSVEFPLVDSMEAVDPTAGDVWHVPLIVKIAPAGNRVVYAAVLGARIQDGTISQVVADGAGGAVAVGSTPSSYFPLTGGALLGGGYSFLLKATPGIYPTTVESSSNPVGPAQPVTLTALVANPATGAVTFKDGTATLGSSAVVNGFAVLSVTLSPGIHRITATNSADGKTSPVLFQIVNGQ